MLVSFRSVSLVSFLCPAQLRALAFDDCSGAQAKSLVIAMIDHSVLVSTRILARFLNILLSQAFLTLLLILGLRTSLQQGTEDFGH